MSDGRVALVTGGGGGIGGAICRSLAKAGHRVAVADIAVDAARALSEEIGGLAVELDVTDPNSIVTAIEEVENELGAIEILVNCAGWDDFKPFI